MKLIRPVFRGNIALSLLRDDMDEHRAFRLLGALEGFAHTGDVVPINRPIVLQPQRLKELAVDQRGLQRVAQPFEQPAPKARQSGECAATYPAARVSSNDIRRFAANL